MQVVDDAKPKQSSEEQQTGVAYQRQLSTGRQMNRIGPSTNRVAHKGAHDRPGLAAPEEGAPPWPQVVDLSPAGGRVEELQLDFITVRSPL